MPGNQGNGKKVCKQRILEIRNLRLDSVCLVEMSAVGVGKKMAGDKSKNWGINPLGRYPAKYWYPKRCGEKREVIHIFLRHY